MAASFDRTYVSIVLVAACLLSAPVSMGVGYFYFGLWGAVVVTLPFLLLLLLYGWVRVALQGHYLGIIYGVGLHKVIIPLTRVQEQKVVPNTRLSWVFVPGASHVLELELRGRQSFTVPVPEPTTLMRAITETLRG